MTSIDELEWAKQVVWIKFWFEEKEQEEWSYLAIPVLFTVSSVFFPMFHIGFHSNSHRRRFICQIVYYSQHFLLMNVELLQTHTYLKWMCVLVACKFDHFIISCWYTFDGCTYRWLLSGEIYFFNFVVVAAAAAGTFTLFIVILLFSRFVNQTVVNKQSQTVNIQTSTIDKSCVNKFEKVYLLLC